MYNNARNTLKKTPKPEAQKAKAAWDKSPYAFPLVRLQSSLGDKRLQRDYTGVPGKF